MRAHSTTFAMLALSTSRVLAGNTFESPSFGTQPYGRVAGSNVDSMAVR